MQRYITPWIAAGIGALVVAGLSWLPLSPSGPAPEEADASDSAEVQALLARLKSECDPDSLANNYQWSSNAPPTERHRREILERLHALRPAAFTEVKAMLQRHKEGDEFHEMLIVLAAAFGDESMVLPAAKLLAYSDHPAVRLSAAREFRKLRDPRTIEWLEMAANTDDRVVRNDGCGNTSELYYPVRTAAVLALRDMGIEFKTQEELQREKLVRELEQIRAKAREMQRRVKEAR